jgi:hypothetical protein
MRQLTPSFAEIDSASLSLAELERMAEGKGRLGSF